MKQLEEQQEGIDPIMGFYDQLQREIEQEKGEKTFEELLEEWSQSRDSE